MFDSQETAYMEPWLYEMPDVAKETENKTGNQSQGWENEM